VPAKDRQGLEVTLFCLIEFDRRPGEEREVFSSKILPPYLRKTKSLEELLP
jgi:hypothetical protein